MTIYRSSSGITIRQDQDALFGYLPREGFAFFAPSSDYDIIKAILVTNKISGCPTGYERLLGTAPLYPFCPDAVHSLGDPVFQWELIPLPESPLIINWMLTSKCNHHCVYCYAQDLMGGEIDPTEDEFMATIRAIKAYSPVAIVLTGGEPSLSPFFEKAIAKLATFTSVIIDTNATCLTQEHIEKFKISGAHLRISLDASSPTIHAKTRVPRDKKRGASFFGEIWGVLQELNRNKIPTTIHTVATKHNYSDILNLDITLKNIDISRFRVKLVEPSSTLPNYKNIRGDDRRFKNFINNIRMKITKGCSVPMYFSMDRPRNSVVIVSPSGDFYTESEFADQGKILLDPASPKNPNLEHIRKRFDMHAHARRYLYN